MAARHPRTHEIQCALDLRAAFVAARGQSADLHSLATEIEEHCGHSRLKAMRLAYGWRRAEDAVAAFISWREAQGKPRTGMDVRSWQSWEAGSRPGPTYLDQLSEFFRSNAVLLGFAADYSVTPTGFPSSIGSSREASLKPEEVIAACAEQTARYGVQLDTPIGSYTLDELMGAVHQVAASYPHTPVMPSLLRSRDLVQRAWTLRERCHKPEQLRELHRIAGWLCAVMANASFDLGGMAEAQTQARVADLHGELAGDHGLRAWIRGLQALVAYWNGRPADAAAYAGSAHEFRPATGTALLRAASIQARALAQLQRPDEVDAALRHAEELREDAQEEFTGLLAFPDAKRVYWMSSAHLGTGLSERASSARHAAEEAIALYEADPPEQRRTGELSLARLDLITARLLTGDLDGLVEQVDLVITSLRNRRTESVVRRMAQLARALDQPRLRSEPHVRTVRDAIEEEIRYSPAPAILPGSTSP